MHRALPAGKSRAEMEKKRTEPLRPERLIVSPLLNINPHQLRIYAEKKLFPRFVTAETLAGNLFSTTSR
jgi:hypothetical protein